MKICNIITSITKIVFSIMQKLYYSMHNAIVLIFNKILLLYLIREKVVNFIGIIAFYLLILLNIDIYYISNLHKDKK